MSRIRVHDYGIGKFTTCNFRRERHRMATYDSLRPSFYLGQQPHMLAAREARMERVKFTLCPQCTECPKIEITEKGVTIGRVPPTVRLSRAEWDELARFD